MFSENISFAASNDLEFSIDGIFNIATGNYMTKKQFYMLSILNAVAVFLYVIDI